MKKKKIVCNDVGMFATDDQRCNKNKKSEQEEWLDEQMY